MNERALRKRCKRILRSLGITPPLRVDDLCERLGKHRGRSIRLVPHSLPVPGPYGLWVATGKADYIFYQRETSRAHQDHIILHEVGHILADHHGDLLDFGELDGVFPDIASDSVRRALRRTSYDEVHEQEAELVATIILEWAAVLDRITPHPARSTPTRRVQSALADRQGWL
ncbi:hypothetical protein ABZ729_15565 [Streptomyces sp. NPDC006678]|uniref:hypothetical protein n=1 Tax=unclassified Streptomyces TaxID=2593676 RepID=UPI0033A5EF4C